MPLDPWDCPCCGPGMGCNAENPRPENQVFSAFATSFSVRPGMSSDDQCWANCATPPNYVGCSTRGVGDLGLCDRHRLEIIGAGNN